MIAAKRRKPLVATRRRQNGDAGGIVRTGPATRPESEEINVKPTDAGWRARPMLRLGTASKAEAPCLHDPRRAVADAQSLIYPAP